MLFYASSLFYCKIQVIILPPVEILTFVNCRSRVCDSKDNREAEAHL